MLPHGIIVSLLLLHGILQLEAKTTKQCPPKFVLEEGQCVYDNVADTYNVEDAREACAANGSKLLKLGNYYICEAATLARLTITQTPDPPITQTPDPPKTSSNEAKRCPPKFVLEKVQCVYDNVADTYNVEDAREACAANGSKLLKRGNYYICEAATLARLTITQTPDPPITSSNEGTIAWILVLTFLIGIALSATVLYLKICLKKDDALVSNTFNPDNEELPSIVITEIDLTTEPPSQSDTIDETDSVSEHYDVPPARLESVEPDDTNTNSNDNYSYENVGDPDLQPTDHHYEEIGDRHLPQNDTDEEEYDQPTPLRPLGEVPNHYILNATALRRSALRSSTSACQLPTKVDKITSQPPLPAFNTKGRFSFNCSRSSNEHNITKSEEASHYIMFFKKFKEKGFADWSKGDNASKSSSLNSLKSDDGYVDIKMKDIEVSVSGHV